jgi:hypothetical protein
MPPREDPKGKQAQQGTIGIPRQLEDDIDDRLIVDPLEHQIQIRKRRAKLICTSSGSSFFAAHSARYYSFKVQQVDTKRGGQRRQRAIRTGEQGGDQPDDENDRDTALGR